MAIGYACLQVGSDNTKFSTLQIKTFTEEKFVSVVMTNLNALEQIIKYNIINDIKLFRISSDIIPLASHSINELPWWQMFEDKFKSLGALIKENNIRVSMHPGQYTVINSPNQEVVEKSFKDLIYHNKFLECLNCDNTSKLVLHIGGVYSDKKSAIERFIKNFDNLDIAIKNRLIIENDDKSYNIEELLYISSRINIPVVFDNLHHELNSPIKNDFSVNQWIEKCSKSWKEMDGKQKTHYSQSANDYKNGAHSKYIIGEKFLSYYNNLTNKNIDIMLEVKDKNLSAVKCNLLTSNNFKISSLEKEWAQYKYYVLSKSANIYKEIRVLLNDKQSNNFLPFYKLLEQAIELEESKKAQINTLQHMWGYFKKVASDKEKEKFIKLLDSYSNNKKTLASVKNYVYKLSNKDSIEYLLDSLYFYI